MSECRIVDGIVAIAMRVHIAEEKLKKEEPGREGRRDEGSKAVTEGRKEERSCREGRQGREK